MGVASLEHLISRLGLEDWSYSVVELRYGYTVILRYLGVRVYDESFHEIDEMSAHNVGKEMIKMGAAGELTTLLTSGFKSGRVSV